MDPYTHINIIFILKKGLILFVRDLNAYKKGTTAAKNISCGEDVATLMLMQCFDMRVFDANIFVEKNICRKTRLW